MILVLNAGSSSLKAALFHPDLTPALTASVAEIGGASQLTIHSTKTAAPAPDHKTALNLILAALTAANYPLTLITAAAHRIVHGGATLTTPVKLTPAIVAEIRACSPLAPLHNPANLAAIDALSHLAPTLPQYASFDTAFHATIPAVGTTYALPETERAKGIRRYGFHGLSYASLIRQLNPLPAKLLALHLGNGASLCAILNGRSVATTMGYSPTDGLTMGTRSGSIDPMAVLALARTLGIDQATHLLNHQSGLKALAGTNDMARLLKRPDPEARFAIDHFCHHAARHAGAAITAMGGLDAIAFTGGIGENAPEIRERITRHLSYLGPKPIHIITAQEEHHIARDALTLIATSPEGRRSGP